MVAHAGKPLNVGDLSDKLSAAADNKLPRGELGRKTVTQNSAGTQTVETIASETVQVYASREIQIEAHGTVRANNTSGAFARLLEDGIQIDRKNFYIPAANIDVSYSIKITRSGIPPGNHIYTLQTGASSGGPKVTTIADTGIGEASIHGVTQLLITDVGEAY